MKKKLMVVGLLLCLLAGGVMIARAASGTPEVDRANAKIGFQGISKRSRARARMASPI